MKLLYRNFTIGRIDEAFESDGTWFGTLTVSEFALQNDEVSRALQFIKFCESWNLSQTSDNPRTADEFNAFYDFIGNGVWQVDDGCSRQTIMQAPNFLGNSEVSWAT